MSDKQNLGDILSEINSRLKNIEEKLEKMELLLQGLSLKTEDIEKSTGNMDEHINFVNEVYDGVKAPFHFMMNMVSSYNGIEDKSSQNPVIKHNN